MARAGEVAKPSTILSDTSDQDLLGFQRYVAPLVQILKDPATVTPLTLGVFGTWGTGKSTLLNMLDSALATSTDPEFLRVPFNAWLHRREPNMLIPLLHTLRDTMALDAAQRFTDSAKKLGSILVRLGLGLILKTVTAGGVSLDKLEALEAQYEKATMHVESDLRKLRTTLQEEMTHLAKAKVRVVLFIDDLDRCEPSDIIELLEAIKLFLDLKNVFVILAVDKEIIDRGIEIRYGKFRFSANRKAAIGAEYLEKMVQLPIHLHPMRATDVRGFIQAMRPGPGIAEHVDFLARVCAPNPRKIKRVLNMLALSLLTEADPPTPADPAVLQAAPPPSAAGAQTNPAAAARPERASHMVRLIVLQVQYPRLYAEVVAYPELLQGLEQQYVSLAPLRVDDLHWAGTRRDVLFGMIQDHWRPQDPHLTALFKGAGWRDLAYDALQLHLSRLGR